MEQQFYEWVPVLFVSCTHLIYSHKTNARLCSQEFMAHWKQTYTSDYQINLTTMEGFLLYNYKQRSKFMVT